MNRGPLARRYWSSLTGVAHGPTAQRNWHGQPFWRRYIASFFVLPQPPGQGTQRIRIAKEARAPQASASQPQRLRAPRLFRYQSVVLGGAAVLAVVVVSVTQLGGGSPPGNGGANPGPSNGGTRPSPTPSTSASSTPSSTSPSKVQLWQGTIRVNVRGEQVTAGPSPVAGLLFGLAATNQTTLNGPGNLAPWTQDGTPTAATCLATLQAHATNQLTVQVGDQVCIAALDGRTAAGKVTAEAANDTSGAYIDLDVEAYP
ncbi:hypothetical protein [Catenulispora rubra]|uniref:hypothetical protein n=1 Tax=Catenulispora rubra TaxID=280293 RepID=UPI0018925E41|nr:hypothetical protein [Catenulispora rubra]